MKKENPKTVTVKLTEEQMALISRALEVFSRAQMGQFKIAFGVLFPMAHIPYEDALFYERQIKRSINESKPGTFPDSGGEYGITSNQLDSSAQKAHQIQKTFDEYLAVQRNNGFWGIHNDFYGPCSFIKQEIPEIVDFKKYKDFPVAKKYIDELRDAIDKKNWDLAWEIVHKQELKNIRGSQYEIIKCNPPCGSETYGGRNDWYALRVHKPQNNQCEAKE